MASGLEILRDKRLANGGLSNLNCPPSDEDPHILMEEFCSLYSEKLKKIDEEYPDSLEPKCQALTELVSDLSEQNFMLLKTVEELEKEALGRAEAYGDLAEAAKQTMQQDVLSDLTQLLELMRRLREDKKLCACGLSFKTVKYEDIFGKQPMLSPNAVERCPEYCSYQYGGEGAYCTKTDLPKFTRYQRKRYRMGGKY